MIHHLEKCSVAKVPIIEIIRELRVPKPLDQIIGKSMKKTKHTQRMRKKHTALGVYQYLGVVM